MLTADQLFNPGLSGVGTDPNVAPAPGTWFDDMLQMAQILGLNTTSWQPGAPERTIMSIDAVALAQSDVFVSLMAQGGFLDFAASGTVTTVLVDGTVVTVPVTPDPSIPSQNPTGAPGWLDALGQSFFEEPRLLATYASGQLAIANTAPGTQSFPSGTYHTANASTGATYANTSDIVVPTSAIAGTGGVVTGVTVGTTTSIATQSAHGLAVGSVVYFAGANGVTGLNGEFATVLSTPTPTTFTVSLTTSGAWSSGGTVYSCTVVQMQADTIGVDGNAGVGLVSVTVTQATGVFVDNLTAWSAANYESNVAYAKRCRLKLASRSPNGPSQAYEFVALTAQRLLADKTPPVAMTNGPIAIATTFSNPLNGVVTTLVASSTPATATLGGQVTPGCAQLGITGATNATPIEVSTASAHGLSTGNAASIAAVLGNTAANGGWTITVTASNKFTLNGSVGNGAYTGGGNVEGGDLGQVDGLIQASVVPDGQSEITKSALAFPLAIGAVVVVPQAFLATYTAAAPAALQALVQTYPVGGNVPPGGSVGTVPWSAIEGALIDAGVITVGAPSYVRQVTSLTINGVAVDVDYPAPEYQAQLVAPAIQVVGV